MSPFDATIPLLQAVVQTGRRLVPRGWAPLIRTAARAVPSLRAYPARMSNGDRMVLDLRHDMCIGYLFDGGQPYGTGLDRLMERVLDEGSTFVDVGANIGYYTRMASRLVGASGHVHAFEPLPAAQHVLAANVGDRANVTLHPMAVGASVGEVDFYARARGDISSMDPAGGGERIRVRLTTLDEALAGLPRLDLLKIDTEGFELEVLRGAREILARHRPVVFFEYLLEFAGPRGFALDDFRALLEPLGYRLFWSNDAGNGPPVRDGEESRDIVALATPWIQRLRPG